LPPISAPFSPTGPLTTAKPVALAAVAAAAWGAPALAGAGPDPAALLRASTAAPAHVSYVGQLETVRFASKRAAATLVRIEHRAPRLTRRSFLAPESLYGDYIVVKGDRSFFFDTRRGRLTVEREDVPDDTSVEAEDLGRILANYRPMIGGTAIVAGRPCDVVILVNKHTGERTVRLWIDTETHLILRREEYRTTGAVAVTARFEEIRYTNALPDELFPTQPPAGFSLAPEMQFAALSPGLQAQAREAGFAPVTPKNLPQGFDLVGSQAATVNGVKTLHLTYSDGLRSLSLFENARGAAVDFGAMHPQTVSFEGHEAQYVEDGSTVLLAWHEQGLHFTLVGDLSKNELIDIAKSVVP
jgi:negative regulator of sigma E activity